MSRIEELLQELAPRGVEVQSLGDIATFVRGNGMPKSDLTDSGVGAIHYGQIYTRYGVWTTSTISFVSPETATKLAKAEPGDIIITNTSENIEDVGKAVAWLGQAAIVTGGHATVIKHRQDPKYLAYWFQSESFFAQKKALATGTKVIDVSAKQLAKVRVPIPPLEVQREIVRVLGLLRPKRDVMSPRFLTLAYLGPEFQRTIEARTVHGATVDRILIADLGSWELAIPSLGEQERIVRTLDAFDALVNDLSVGLPAELAARRKQYEYYRDKLLTFDEAA